MTILIFLAVLFVLILVHEWGHFIVAKKTGMRVDEFGIGFPPRLFGIKKGETLYSINALPIGGFVKIFGENAEDAQQAKEEGRVVENAFTSKSKWAQSAVLVAGVTMNILFAWFLFVLVLAIGVPTSVPEEQAGDSAQLVITGVLEESPAAQAQIPLGARISGVSANGETLTTLTPSAFSDFTQSHAGEELTVSYRSGDDTHTVSVTPTQGVIQEQQDQVAVGVALSLIETVRQPIHIALLEATVRTYESLVAIVVGIGTLLWQAVQFDADLSQVAGPVGIVGLVGDAAEFGIASLLLFTAIISLNLAVINLLPFPALDGGRLLFVAIEAVMRKPIRPIWVARLNTVGFLLLMLLMVAVTYNDLMRIF